MLYLQQKYVELKAPECLSLRPIVAGLTCETHRLSNLIDILLQPYTKHIKSYIKDTTDFLSKLPTSTNPDTLLVSFGVVNLYTNIPMIWDRSHRILVEKVSTGVASKDFGRMSARRNQIHFRKQLFLFQ